MEMVVTTRLKCHNLIASFYQP